MLVLSRKVDQEVMIGNDIKLTIVRIEGNRVRIGISAPRDLPILRGELAAKDAAGTEIEFELSEREFAFAHQQATDRIAESRVRQDAEVGDQLFTGTVRSDGSSVSLHEVRCPASRPAPLAGFVSAS